MAPPGLGFGVGLVAVSFQHSLFVCVVFSSLLALWFLELYRSFTMYK